MSRFTAVVAIIMVITILYTVKELYPAFPSIGVAVALGYVIGKSVEKDKDEA